MNRVVRRKLAMAKRVRDFCRAHPVDTTGFREVMEELEWRLKQAAELVAHRLSAGQREDGTTSLKNEIGSTIREKYLKNLARIARGAIDLDPLLAVQIKLPRKHIGSEAFLAQAETLIDAASRRQDLFIRDGMPATFVADARALLAHYGRLMQPQNDSRSHLRALHEINEMARGVFRMVRRLDGINELRYQEDPAMLEAWSAVRNPPHGHVEPSVKDGLDPAA